MVYSESYYFRQKSIYTVDGGLMSHTPAKLYPVLYKVLHASREGSTALFKPVKCFQTPYLRRQGHMELPAEASLGGHPLDVS